MATPLVSIVIPVFNDQAGMERCLDAIAQQSYPTSQIEVIAADNRSDPPLALARQYPFSTQVLRCDRPGSYAARNAGVKASIGRVLAFIDADCWPDKDWLATGITALMESGGNVVIGGEVLFTEQNKQTAVALYQRVSGFGQESNIRNRGFTATANLICSRADFDVIGYFDEKLFSCGDREWCWRAAQTGITVRFSRRTLVYTEPRCDLNSAIRQARRVMAGRRALRKMMPATDQRIPSLERTNGWDAVATILRTRELCFQDRLRALAAGIVIRMATITEAARLTLGFAPERR